MVLPNGFYGYTNTNEGSQYKYYKNINAIYNVRNTELEKVEVEESDGSHRWFTRTPFYGNDGYFCYVNFAGNCYIGEADSKGGIAPCFSV